MKRNKNLYCFALFAFVLAFATSCKTDEIKVDGTGNVYHSDTIHLDTIGTQVWMRENLSTTKYNNGDPISNITNNTEWEKSTTGAYCNYENDLTVGAKYGKLYNWYAVKTGKLAPKGWHVATDQDWTTLEEYLISNIAATNSISKLAALDSVAKALASKTDWNSSITMGTIGFDLTKNNTKGFSALPAGYRGVGGAFNAVGSYAGWWSSTESSATSSMFRAVDCTASSIYKNSSLKSYGLSVRCVKDAK